MTLRSDQVQSFEGARGESFPPAAGGIFTLRLTWAILAVFFVLAYLAPLNLSGLWQPDETRYGEISREMVASGDWVAPRLLGVRYFEKPVAGYWINNISQLAFGENNFSVRFGSAASTGLSAVLVFCLAMMLWRERRAAFASALVYLSMLLVAGIGTYSVLDPMLTLWMTAAMACSWLALRADTRARRAGAWILLGLACGMGFLTKGFVALAVPVVAVLPVFVREKRFTELLCYGPLAVAAAALISLPWSLMVALKEPGYWNYFFWVEHVQRFAGKNAQHSEPFWFYLPWFAAGCLPWLGFLPGALRWGRQERMARPERFFLLCWCLMPLLLFSVAKGKLPTYILPCMAPLALLLARYGLDSAGQGRERPARINGFINAGFGIVALLALAGLVLKLVPSLPAYEAREWAKPLLGGLALVFWCLMAGLSLRRRPGRWLLAAACPLLLALTAGSVLPNVLTVAKQPQAFIREHETSLKNSRFILANNVGMATALAWELKRSDLLIIRDSGELTYGFGHADSWDRLLQERDVAGWLKSARQQGDVSMLLRVSRKKVEAPDWLPAPDAVSRMDRYVLLLYRQQAGGGAP